MKDASRMSLYHVRINPAIPEWSEWSTVSWSDIYIFQRYLDRRECRSRKYWHLLDNVLSKYYIRWWIRYLREQMVSSLTPSQSEAAQLWSWQLFLQPSMQYYRYLNPHCEDKSKDLTIFSQLGSWCTCNFQIFSPINIQILVDYTSLGLWFHSTRPPYIN